MYKHEIYAAPIEIAWNPDLSIFASSQFLKTVGNDYGWLGGTDEAGRLRCILPYTIIRKAFVKMVRFRMETIQVGEELSIEEEKSFLGNAVKRFRSLGADIIIPASPNAIFRTYPQGAVAIPYGTYVIDLGKSEDILWANIHQKHRNVIRNASKKGVLALRGLEYAETAYKLVRDTFKRSQLAVMNVNDFRKMVYGLGEFAEIFVAEHQNAMQGCAVFAFSNHSAYYMYGGTVPKPLTGAMNFLQWEAIKHFRALGVMRYDFYGVRINPDKHSKQAGLMMFKERFGPRLIQGYMWKKPINPIKAAVYSVGVRLMRGGDIVDSEKKVMRNVNQNGIRSLDSNDTI